MAEARRRRAALDSGPARRALLEVAERARSNAYAPYSRFRVGAALLAADGRVFIGCNVENASYGLTMCAERVALGAAVSQGATEFMAIAIAGPSGAAAAPCGACRQALMEFSPEIRVYYEAGSGRVASRALRDLLPHAFRLPRR